MAHSKRPKQVNRKALSIRTGDEVIVISGSGSKDKTPKKVIEVLTKERKVVVEGVNVMKDRVRSKTGQGQHEVVEKACAIPASRVALIDPKTKKPTRVKIQKDAEGKKVRVAKSGEVIA
jgi:large subunit ribosomal protein L24